MRTVVVSKSIGMTIEDAQATLKVLGIAGIRVRSVGRSSPQSPRVRPARRLPDRGARFIREERQALFGEPV